MGTVAWDRLHVCFGLRGGLSHPNPNLAASLSMAMGTRFKYIFITTDIAEILMKDSKLGAVCLENFTSSFIKKVLASFDC